MSRAGEAALLAGAALLAAFGAALVNLAFGQPIDAEIALTLLVFLIAWGSLHLAIRRWAPRANPLILPPAALLSALGWFEIYRLSPIRGSQQRWWLLVAAGVGVLTLFGLSKIGLQGLRRYRNLLFAFGMVILLLPLLPLEWGFPLSGFQANGSRLWIIINLGFTDLHFQPAELAKPLLVVALAAYLADRQPAFAAANNRMGRVSIPELRQLLPVAIVWVLSMGILIYQRDLGASLLLFAAFVGLLYIATARLVYPTLGLVFFGVGAAAAWSLFPHVQTRVSAWLAPFADFQGAGFQTAQGLFALGSGSISGAGPGLGRPTVIPNATTDFIFAALGEELGFAGTAMIIAAFGLLVAIGFGIALRSNDQFRSLVAAGLTLVLGLQVFLIIGGVVRIVPLTGVALPFMSYGGSSLLGSVVLLCLLARVSHEERT